MAIEFTPGRYYVAMWYLGVPATLLPPNGGNFMACLWREDAQPELWTVQWRHRYYTNLDEGIVVRSNDIFHWYEFQFKGDENKGVEAMTRLLHTVAPVTGNKPEVLWIRGDSEKLLTLAKSDACPEWLHSVPAEGGVSNE